MAGLARLWLLYRRHSHAPLLWGLTEQERRKKLLHLGLEVSMIVNCQDEGGGAGWFPHRPGRKYQEVDTQKAFG